MSKFIRLNKKNGGCPVCNSDSGKCKQLEDIYLCMESSGAIPGLHYLGQSSDGTWGQYKFDDGTNDYQRPERIPEPEGIKLPAKERDAAIKSILRQLPLDERDRQDLIRRGLTNEQINNNDWGFASVSKNSCLEIPVNNELAGIAIDGKHFCIKPLDAGYFVFIKDINEYFVGAQLKVRNPRDGQKYKWLKSSKNARREFDAVSHTAEFNELPLQHSIVNNVPGQPLLLTEGTGKPRYASLRFDINAIGASGGNFVASQETLINSLDILKPSQIILGADSGSRINPQVLRQYRRLNLLLKELGLSLYVADWGQASDKSKLDIDELPSLDNITIKLYSDWDVASAIAANQIFDIDKETDWKQKMIFSAHQAWKNNKKYTPSPGCTFDEDYCISPLAPKPGEIVALKYHTNQGKTTKIKRWDSNELKGFGAVKLSYRNSLEYQFAASSDFIHLKEDNGKLFILDPMGRTTSCIDSILNYDDSSCDDKYLIIDEVESVMLHLLEGGTLKENQQAVINKFKTLARRCLMMIIADGNLSDVTCNFIQEISGKPIIKYYNKRLPKRPKCTVYDKVGNRFERIAEQIKDEPFPWVMSTTQIDCEIMEKHALRAGKKPLRIDSKTINDPVQGLIVKRFLSDPDGFLTDPSNDCDCIISSPTIESGVDCNYTGFSGVYLLIKHLSTNNHTQTIIRARDVNTPRHIASTKYIRNDNGGAMQSPFIKTLDRAFYDFQKQSIDSIGPELGISQDEIVAMLHRKVDEAFNTPEQRLFTIYQAVRNYEQANTLDCLIESLQDSGYEIIIDRGVRVSSPAYKECKDEVKKETATDITEAAEITESEHKAMSKRQDLDWKDRCSVTKFRLLQRLPNIGNDWNFGLVYHLLFKNKKLISQAELRWMLNHPELAVKRSKKAYHSVIKYDKTFLGKFKTLLPMIKEFNRLGIKDILDNLIGDNFDNTTATVKALWDGWGRLQETRTGIARGANPTTLIKRLGSRLGYDSKETSRSGDSRGYCLIDLLADDELKSFSFEAIDSGENPPTSIGAIVAKCVNERLETENQDIGLCDDDWIEFLQGKTPERPVRNPSSDDKSIHEYITTHDPICHRYIPDWVNVTAIPVVENVTKPEPIPEPIPEPEPELITAPTSTPEPDPDPLTWKGATGRIKPEIAPYWLEVYKIYKERNPLTRSGARVKSVDNAPTWKHNAMAPNGGGLVLLVEIEGLIGTKINVPIECLEFEG
jgi:hypothetical protein